MNNFQTNKKSNQLLTDKYYLTLLKRDIVSTTSINNKTFSQCL